MSFFSNIGKAIGKATQAVTKTVGKVLQTAAPLASMIPGVGTVIGGAAGILGGILAPEKQAAIVEAVADQGVVKVEKIEQTIAKAMPSVDASTLQVATQAMVKTATDLVPSAKIDDSKSVTNVSMIDKVTQWVKSNMLIAGAAAVGGAYFLFFRNKKGGYRRY